MNPQDILPEMRRLETYFGAPVFLAGGALRDHFHGRDIKDFDIFVPADKMTGLEPDEIASVLGPHWVFTDAIPEEYLQGDMAEECGPIYEFREVYPGLGFNFIPETPPIQMIGLRLREGHEWDMDGVLNRIDIGLCRIGLQSNGMLHAAREYYKDAENRTLTIVDRRDVPRSTDRAYRIRQKYPEFSIVGTVGLPTFD